MSLVHGKAISSEEIESIVSRQFSARDFANLCNSIAWASSGRRCSSLPSFTERVNVKDGGIDAEWEVDLPEDSDYYSPLLGPGWNVSQYKQRDIFASGREQTFASLKAGLKGEIKKIFDRTGRRPDRYVVFVNIDMTHFTEATGAAKPQKEELRRSILEGYDKPENVHVEIVGAAELSTFLNSLPYLRSAFFAPVSFTTWRKYQRDHYEKKLPLFGAKVELVGREEELADLRLMVDEPGVRVVVLSGPHNIGKTRLALEATAHRPIETVVALDPRSMSVSDLLALESPGVETMIIIEDPEPDVAEKYVDQVLAHAGLKLFITLPTAENAPTPNFGRDKRVQIKQIDPFSEQQARELLKNAQVELDYGVESWIIEQAGGNPGILLLAARLGTELRRTAASFTDDVARTFEQKIRRELGDKAIEELRLLSLLTHVGVRGKPAKELEGICSLFGNNIKPNVILNDLRRLTGAGVVREGGSYVEVLPPLFANRLATSALQGNSDGLFALFATLDQMARMRLLRRLRAIPRDEVAFFWDELFGQDGLFKDLPSALRNGYMLRQIAGTVPEKVSHLVESNLLDLSVDERLSIKGSARRELVWTLEELLFRRKTSATAVRYLAMLAEAETEDVANNATGIFCACFHPRHPQFPLPLQNRLTILKDILDSNQSVELRMLGVKAIDAALTRIGFSMPLRRSSGPDPLDSRPSMTYGEIWDYIESLAELLLTTAQSSKDTKLVQCVIDALPRVIAESTIQARPELGVSRFQIVTSWALTHKMPISVSDLTSALKLTHDTLNGHIGEVDEETDAVLMECVGKIEALIDQIDKGDFSTRLKRWAGDWTRYDHEYEIDESGNRVYRAGKELQILAEEAVGDAEALSNDLLSWLCSDAAKKANIFFGCLGELDLQRQWLPKIELIGQESRGRVVFSAYFGGLSKTDKAFVANRLDELVEESKVVPEAIVYATWYLSGDLAGIKRMERLIQEERVDPVFVEKMLSSGSWIDSLSSSEFLRLLKAIAGPGLENALVIIDFFGMWLHNKQSIKGKLADFAWLCLEAAPPVTDHSDAYDCDRLAAKLTQSDLERGFRLLVKLLTLPFERKSWNPIDRHSRREFWNVLCQADSDRTYRLVIDLALEESSQHFGIPWDIYEMINQELDADVLLSIASENEQQAELVCNGVSTERPDFWDIALNIIEKYPNNRRIQSALARGVEQMGWEFKSGPYSLRLENYRKDVERVLNDTETPAVARPWLEELESSLRERAERALISEADEEINDLMRAVENPASPERLWAIRTLLRLGKTDAVQRLLSNN